MPHEADEQQTNPMHPDNLALRTWWVKLDMETAAEMQKQIRALCGWTRHLWHSRLHGKSLLTTAEKTVIETITSQPIFSHEGN